MDKFMKEAIKEAERGITNGDGGPFGAVVVKDGVIVGKGHNKVLKNNDATCHGEIEAIKSASKKLGTFDLSDCLLFTTGEPCPMCLSACLWANIEKVYYGCSISDNEKIGFRDKKFDTLIGGRKKLKNYLEELDRKECLELFEKYLNLENRKNY